MEWGFGMGETFNIHYNIFPVDQDRDHDPATSVNTPQGEAVPPLTITGISFVEKP